MRDIVHLRKGSTRAHAYENMFSYDRIGSLTTEYVLLRQNMKGSTRAHTHAFMDPHVRARYVHACAPPRRPLL